jgi:hypothetical protein
MNVNKIFQTRFDVEFYSSMKKIYHICKKKYLYLSIHTPFEDTRKQMFQNKCVKLLSFHFLICQLPDEKKKIFFRKNTLLKKKFLDSNYVLV